MLASIDIKDIEEIITRLQQEGRKTDGASVSQELIKTGNPKFQSKQWDGHPQFLTMIKEYPEHFQIIEHTPKNKEIVLISDGNVTPTPGSHSSRRMTFEDYLSEVLTKEYIDALCQRFKLTEDMKDPYIIKQYLKYTYYKAESEEKVLACGDVRMLHTGWFNNGIDPIYCVWTENGAYQFHFVPQSEPECRALRRIFNNQVPEKITFPRMEFNPDLSIELEFGHIIGERNNRIPIVVKKMILATGDVSVNDSTSVDTAIPVDNHNFVCRLLLGSLEDTRLRIRNNTEEAIPFWNKRNEKMSWLFPLRMDTSDEVNLVAILEPTTLNGKDIYRAHTVLRLKESYINARILGPVTAEWLKDAWH